MYTYQDFLTVKDEKKRAEMIRSTVQQHIASKAYLYAEIADEYYHKHEPAIEKVMKFYYTVTGRKEEDIYASNLKLKLLFFRKKVTQHVAYVLNKGIIMDADAKGRLDKNLEAKAKRWTKYAMVAGKSYVFYNAGNLEIFHMVCNDYHPGFAPVYDADTGLLAAGVRFYFVTADKKRRMKCTFYEPDGYTEYSDNDDGTLEAIGEKRPYVVATVRDAISERTVGRNYGRLPIVEAVTNDCRESEIVGLMEDIDAYEFTKSDLGNELADFSGIWYSIENAGGMTDKELAKFIQRLKTVRAAVVGEDGSGSARVTANTQQIPYEARAKMLEIIKADLYENSQLLDLSQLSAAQKTTQEIQAACTAQENYCGDLRDYIIYTIHELMEIAGIPYTPVSMEFDRIINVTEITNVVMTSLPLIGEDVAIEVLPFLNAEQKQRVKEYRKKEAAVRFAYTGDDGDEDGGDE